MDTSNTQAISANVRLRYNYRPDSDLVHHLQRGHAIRQHRPGKPATGARDSICGEMDLCLRAMKLLVCIE